MKKKGKIWLIILGIIVAAVAAILIIKATKSANKELVVRTHVVEIPPRRSMSISTM